MSIGHEQLRGIERRSAIHHALIGESLEERDQIVEVLRRHVQLADLEVDELRVVLAEVATSVVEIHHLQQRRLTAVVEVGRSQFDIAQERRLEGSR